MPGAKPTDQDTTLYHLFSSAFWRNKRWIAYPQVNSFSHKSFIKFFSSFRFANAFCRRRSTPGRVFVFAALADVMKAVHGSKKITGQQTRELSDLLLNTYAGLKIYSVTQIDRWVEAGAYFPVVIPGQMRASFCIARVNGTHKKLDFFDGKLSRYRPATAARIISIDYFDF